MLFLRRFLYALGLSFLFIFIVKGHCYSQGEGAIKSGDPISKTESDSINSLLNDYIHKVDSIGRTTGVAGHFARIYTASMGNINFKLQVKDTGARVFIKKFEIAFIGYFLHESFEFEKGHEIGSVWNCYFSNPDAQSWQLTLIGVNAHINGDIWKGLATNFSADEIKRYKKDLLSFQSSISKAFQPFFDDLMAQNSYLRFINSFTKGSAKRYGEWLIYNWRLRQINLAILFHKDQEKFKKKLAAINRKKQRIDKIILRKKKFL